LEIPELTEELFGSEYMPLDGRAGAPEELYSA
jgi:hypothetical protein